MEKDWKDDGRKLPDVGPIDGRQPLLLQQGVALREMAAAEEAPVGRQRRGMRSRKHMMPRRVDKPAFGNGIAAPQQEHNAVAMLGQRTDGSVCERLPAMPLM